MPYQRVTLATLKQRLSEKTGNQSTFWVDAEWRDALNEAICYWQGLVGEWVETRALTAPGVGGAIDIPAQVVSLYRVSYVTDTGLPGPGTPLVAISIPELDNGFVGWQGVSGTPLYWAPAGINKMVTYPFPTAGYFRLEYWREAPTLTSPGDFIDIGDEELVRLLGYAQWYLSFKEGVREAVRNPDPLIRDMISAAVERNKRLLASAYYRGFMGEVREEEERPTRDTAQKTGIRKEDYSGTPQSGGGPA